MTLFRVPEMTCGHCKAAIEKSVAAADPDARVTVALDSHTVRIESVLADAALIAAMSEAGYEASVTG